MADWANAAAVLASRSHLKSEKSTTHSANVVSQPSGGSPGNLSGSKSPVSSASASARAALLAHKSSVPSHLDIHESEMAAQESVRTSREKALLAAKKSMSTVKVPERKLVMPKRESDSSHQRIVARQQESESRNRTIHIRREMLTEHPPIRMEVEEQRHKDALHASAISLARNVYAKNNQASRTTPVASHGTRQGVKQDTKQYLSLQAAAQKLATERLSRIKEPDGVVSLRNYYGYPDETQSKSSRRTNLLHKVRHPLHARSVSDGEDDATRSQHVRSQMALLQEQIAHVDSEKLTQDRARLMVMAEKKVHQQMHKLDEEVFNETGKMSPAMMSEWDAKARARVREHNQISMRETKPDSAVDVGAGKLVDRSEVEELAFARVGPTLRRIDHAVEKRKAEEAEQSAKEEERKRMAREEKEKTKQERAEKKKAQEEEKKGRIIKEHQAKAGDTVEEIIEGKDDRRIGDKDNGKDGQKNMAIEVFDRFYNPFTRRVQEPFHDEQQPKRDNASKENISKPATTPHLQTAASKPERSSNARETLDPHQTDKEAMAFDKHDRVPMWRKFTHKRSKSDSENDETDHRDQQLTASKIKSTFANIMRQSKAQANVIERQREDGESTELEDSSDTGSFHSTTPFPEVHNHTATTTQLVPESFNAEAEVAETNTSSSHPTAMAVPGLVEAEESLHQEHRTDKLEGAHLETKFHEEL